MPNYEPEKLQELYKNLPKDLQEALFSDQVAQNIQEICEKAGVKGEGDIFDVSRHVGYVMLGLLPPNDFQEVIKKEIELDNLTSKNITDEVKRFIFYPIRKTLETLYGVPLIIPAAAVKPQAEASENSEGEAEGNIRINVKDSYREPIE